MSKANILHPAYICAPNSKNAMKKIITTVILAALGLSALASNDVPVEQTDTLSNSVVTGTRKAVSRDLLPVPVSVVGRHAIEQSDANDIFPALVEQVPGLYITTRGVTGYSVSNGAAGSISLRGFNAGSGRVLVLIDGHPQFEAIYGHPVADEYLAGDAERVEVTRGPASVLYGSNAMGGAINIITRKPAVDGNHISAKAMGGSFGTFRGSFTDTYKNGRFSAVAGINHDRTAGHRENSAFNSTGGMLKGEFQVNDNWNISANADLMRAYSENPGTVSQPMFEGTADVKRLMTGLSLSNSYDKVEGAVNFYYNWGEHIINDGYTQGGKPREFLFNGVDYMGGVNLFESINLFKGNTITLGSDVKLYGGNAYRDPVKEIYADHKKIEEHAGYVFDQYTIGKFMLNAGLRIENNSVYGRVAVPQAGIAYSPEQGTSLKLSASKGFRTPNMRELYMYAVANEELLPEEAWSYDFTASKAFLDGRLNTELSLFYTTGSNIIEVTVVEGKRQNRNAGEFANSGAELSLSYRLASNVNINANYSYLHMDKILVGAPEHKAYLGCNWQPGKFSFNLGAMSVSGLWLSTGENGVSSNYVDVKARASYKVTDWMDIFARGENLLNQKYETLLGFPMPGATVLAGISINL